MGALDDLLKGNTERGSASSTGQQAYSSTQKRGGLDTLLMDDLQERQKSPSIQVAPTSRPSNVNVAPTSTPQQSQSSTISVAPQGGEQKRGLWDKVKGGLSSAANGVVNWWKNNQQKNNEATFKMREMMYSPFSTGNKEQDKNIQIQKDPTTKKMVIVDKTTGQQVKSRLQLFEEADPETRLRMMDEQNQEIPLIKMMNSKAGRKAIGGIAETTSNMPLKVMARLRSLGSETYDEAYNAFVQERDDPNNPAWQRFLWELQDSGPQTAIGVLLSVGTSYVSRNPNAGVAVSSAYYTALSADSQLRERGRVDSLGNIAIDVVGDQMLNSALTGVFKGGKGALRVALQGAGIEGTTEVSQTLLKYTNDWNNATSEEERQRILEEAKRYVTDGGMAMEFAVSATAGGLISGGVSLASPSIQTETESVETKPVNPLVPSTDDTNVVYRWEGQRFASDLEGNEFSKLAAPTLGEANYFSFDPKSSEQFGTELETFSIPNDLDLYIMKTDDRGDYSGDPQFREFLKESIDQKKESTEFVEYMSRQGYDGVIFRSDDNANSWLALKKELTLNPVAPKVQELKVHTVEEIRDSIDPQGDSNSEAFDVDRAIANGDIEATTVYKDLKTKTLTPEFAQGRINDVAQKLDLYRIGLGQKYRARIDVNNSTMEAITTEGLAVLDEAVNIQLRPDPQFQPEKYYAALRDDLRELQKNLDEGDATENEIIVAMGISSELQNYEDLNKDTAVIVTDQGRTAARVETVRYDDGQFAYRFDATTDTASVISPFLYDRLYPNSKAATNAGVKELTNWLRTNQRDNPNDEGYQRILLGLAKFSVKRANVKAAERKQKAANEAADLARRTGGAFIGTRPAGSGVKGEAFASPLITRTQLLTLYRNSPEFQDNPVLIVKEEQEYEGGKTSPRKYLTFSGERNQFKIRPEALGLSPENIKEGDNIPVDIEELKKPKSEMRIKQVKEGKESIIGFNPKNLEDTQDHKFTEETDKIVKRSEIAKMLEEKLLVPIRRGKFRKNALGIYNPKTQIIRVRERGASQRIGGEISTIFHEVGHFIDYTIFPFGNEISKNPKEREALTSEYGEELKSEKRKNEEAFAEFLRFYMTQPEKAEKFAPNFLKFFEKQMKNMPEVNQVITDAKTDFKRWAEMPSTSKILSQISFEKTNEGVINKMKSTFGALYSQVIDDLHPLDLFSKKAKEKLGNIPADEDPYILARTLRGWVSKAETMLEKGTFDKKYWKETEKGRVVPVFKGLSLRDILKPVEKKNALNELSVYLVAKRGVELAKRNISTGFAAEDAVIAVEELEVKYPEFKTVAEQLYKYQNDVLEYAQQNGLIKQESMDKMREMNKNYVPFFRVMEELESAGYAGKGLGNVRNGIKKIKGSEREIINPLESIVKNTYALVNASERNNVALSMVSLAAKDFELGQRIEKVATPLAKVATVGSEEIERALVKKAMKDAGVFDDPKISEETMADLQGILVDVFRPATMAKGNVITVMHDGTPKFYEVDQELMKAMQAMDVENIGMVMKLLSFPARFLRAGATLTPEFVLRNPARDQWSAFVYSNNGYLPFIDLTRGIFSLLKKDSDYHLWRMGGGEHSMLVSMDREYMGKSLEEVLASRDPRTLKGWKHLIMDMRNPLHIMQVLSALTEKGTRLGEAKKALKRGTNPSAAAYSSREVTLDFARIGSKTKAVNAIVAFFNAQVQDLNRMYRGFKDNPVRTTMKALVGITIPSILLYFVNRDDPRWKEIPQWQKDLFWIVMTDDHVYRIPKPFNLGILFGSVPERTLEWLDNKDPAVFDQLLDSIASGLTPSFIPTAALPIIENTTNYSFFLERPIVPLSKQDLPAEAQYGNYTSETAKKLGELLKYSPAKIDNLLRGYFAGLGQYATEGLDMILKAAGKAENQGDEPTKRIEDMPIAKAFMIKPLTGSGAESVDKFYTKWEEANQAYQYVNTLEAEGDQDKLERYIADHPEWELSKYYNSVQRELSKINKERNMILVDEQLSGDEKRRTLDELDALMLTVAQNALEMSLQYEGN